MCLDNLNINTLGAGSSPLRVALKGPPSKSNPDVWNMVDELSDPTSHLQCSLAAWGNEGAPPMQWFKWSALEMVNRLVYFQLIETAVL